MKNNSNENNGEIIRDFFEYPIFTILSICTHESNENYKFEGGYSKIHEDVSKNYLYTDRPHRAIPFV